MARVSTYLNFPGTTEEAFNYYKSVFGTEFEGGMMKFSDVPAGVDQEPLPEDQKNKVMHVALPILNGYLLMGTDATEAMGFKVNMGNNVYINLEPDSREEVDRLFGALSEGGKVGEKPSETFWGAYYGSCTDRFGVQWMFNYQLT